MTFKTCANIKLIIVLTVLLVNSIESARILGFFYVASISHQQAFQPIWRELSLRGHEVTVVATNPLKDPKLTNLTEIDVGERAYEYMKTIPFYTFSRNYRTPLNIMESFMEIFDNLLEIEFSYEEVQDLLKLDKDYFDLIMIETHNPLLHGFAAKFSAPVVVFSSLGVLGYANDALGNPSHPALYPDMVMGYSKDLSFWQRWDSAWYFLMSRIRYKYHLMPKADALARKYFGKDIPYIEDLMSRTNMLFVNVNPILSTRRPNVPGVIELYQMHITPPKQLPKDLQNMLDKAVNGVVYFSLGSNIKSSNLTEPLRSVLINDVKELPYTVLWKWETDDFPDKPDNVIIRKWFPQQDVLAHPNIKAFVTQGGLQSIEEAMSNGVPLVGLPMFGDQLTNIQALESYKICIALNPDKIKSNDLKNAILKVATNIKYKTNMQNIQSILQDQPVSNLEKAVWWIEYVIRHKGAKHLRSPTADIPWYQYLLLDVLAATLAVLAVILYLIYFMFKVLYTFFSPTKESRPKHD